MYYRFSLFLSVHFYSLIKPLLFLKTEGCCGSILIQKVELVLKVNADNSPPYDGDALDMALPMWKNQGGHLIAKNESYSSSNVDIKEKNQQYFAERGWGNPVAWGKLSAGSMGCNTT